MQAFGGGQTETEITLITNASRNFRGRFGSPEANAYVASSATVVASAIAGRIASPTEFMGH
jgi:3-isopropylmalate/(R)-2-methylmalate dehydratase large subunit